MSDLYLNRAITDAVILAAEHRIATNPAIRATLSSPGNDMKVTEALSMIAA
jgi:hypothetical protein